MTVVVDADVVVKTHRPGTDPHALAVRLRLATAVDCLLSPLSTEPEPLCDRWRSRWPRVEVVPVDPAAAPWAEAGALLARLHTEAVAVPLRHGGPDRLRRALAPVCDGASPIRRAAAGLPDDLWHRGPQTLVHGDWHLGQMGRRDGRWLLIDVDDLGAGHPA